MIISINEVSEWMKEHTSCILLWLFNRRVVFTKDTFGGHIQFQIKLDLWWPYPVSAKLIPFEPIPSFS